MELNKYYKHKTGAIVKVVFIQNRTDNWYILEVVEIGESTLHKVINSKTPNFVSSRVNEEGKYYTWGSFSIIGIGFSPYAIEVKDNKLARKLYPNAEKLENGKLRIIDEI